MKKYNSIPYWNRGYFDTYIYAFNKYDGSNMRFEWDSKNSKKGNNLGFTKYGTRKQMIYQTDPVWGQAVEIFMNKYANQIDKIFREDKNLRNARKMTIFAEYFGENSFAGQHDETDEKDVILFDVDVYQKGIMKPKDFIKTFSHLGIPEVIYEGLYTEQLIKDVQDNIYSLDEGVVVKGTIKTKKKGVENTWMVKIKTNEWLKRVREKHGSDKLLKELNGDKDLFESLK